MLILLRVVFGHLQGQRTTGPKSAAKYSWRLICVRLLGTQQRCEPEILASKGSCVAIVLTIVDSIVLGAGLEPGKSDRERGTRVFCVLSAGLDDDTGVRTCVRPLHVAGFGSPCHHFAPHTAHVPVFSMYDLLCQCPWSSSIVYSAVLR